MKILVTGSSGFIGKNLVTKLKLLPDCELFEFNRNSSYSELDKFIEICDVIVHLGGVNRPISEEEFVKVNEGLTQSICSKVSTRKTKVKLIFASSIQADNRSPYGRSKYNAENMLRELAKNEENSIHIFRFPNVFGKWCRPNYNSVVATFCHNLANGLPITITEPKKKITLVYIDDVVNSIMQVIKQDRKGLFYEVVEPQYDVSLAELSNQIYEFVKDRKNLRISNVGKGFVRALYSTFVSYLPKHEFSYPLEIHDDKRGSFAEVLKTKDSGQISYFTAGPGVVRGRHYHHTKVEKFLVVRGQARFKFKNLLTKEKFELDVSFEEPTIVETIPGWVHQIENVGTDTLLVLLWSSEVFDPENPDTIPSDI